MFFNTRSLITGALVSLLSIEAVALVLQPIKGPGDLRPGLSVRNSLKKRDTTNDFILTPISDPGELTGHFVKRQATGNDAFDPCSRAEMFWGAYAGDNIVTANFTLGAPGDDEMILPLANFAQHLKSVTCGQPGKGMELAFSDKETYTYAQQKWQWVDEKDINHFILVTEMNQCYRGDDRSPYLVKSIKFDDKTLTAKVDGEEQPWEKVANSYALQVSHEYVDPSTANVTHPQLMHKRDGSKIGLNLDKSVTLFDYAKDSKETAGLRLSANAHIQTGGALVADFKLTKNWIGIPNGASISIKAQDLWGQLLLSLQADGKLGKELTYDLKPALIIPVGGFSTPGGLIQVGPIAEMGIHFGSTAIEGVAQISAGTKARVKNSAELYFETGDGKKNTVKDWVPDFEKMEPRFTAEIKAGLKAWAELSFKVKAEAVGLGYEAGIEAELPYFKAEVGAKVDTKAGVCGTKKAAGVEMNAGVGINVHLEAGQPDKDPDWQKDIYQTEWSLYKTCIGVGKDISTTNLPPVPTGGPKDKTTTDKSPATTGAKPTSSGSAKPTSGSAHPTSATGKPSGTASATTTKPSVSGSATTGKPSGSNSGSATTGKPSGSNSGSATTAKPSGTSSGSATTGKPSGSNSGSVTTGKPSGSSSGSATTAKPSSSGSAHPSSSGAIPSQSASSGVSSKPASSGASSSHNTASGSSSVATSSAASGTTKPVPSGYPTNSASGTQKPATSAVPSGASSASKSGTSNGPTMSVKPTGSATGTSTGAPSASTGGSDSNPIGGVISILPAFNASSIFHPSGSMSTIATAYKPTVVAPYGATVLPTTSMVAY